MKHFLLSAIVSAAVAFAQTIPPGTASLEGQVTDTAGHPIRKAALTLRAVGSVPVQHPMYGAASDADGKFSFDAIEPGSYMLSSERAGYLQKFWRSSLHETSGRLTFTAGQRMTGVNLAMTRAATISGRILDSDGDPVSNLQVTILRLRRTYRSGSDLMIERSVQTDAAGRYETPYLAAGQYYLSAGTDISDGVFTIAGMRAVNNSSSDVFANQPQPPHYYLTTYYPGETDPHAAAAISVTAGQSDIQGLDIHLRATPAFTVKGKVTGMIPVPPPNQECRVSLSRTDLPWAGVAGGLMGFGTGAILTKDGTFDFQGAHFAPGNYFLMAYCQQIPLHILARQPLVIRDRNIEDAVLRLDPLVQLHGIVTIERHPHTDFSADSGVNPPPARTMRVSLDVSGGSPLPGGLNTRIQNDGSFTIPDVAPGTYELNVFGNPPGTYVKAIRLGSRDVPDSSIAIDANSAAEPLQITLSRSVGRISGFVQTANGAAAANSTITLLTDPYLPGAISVMTGTDENGRFTTAGIPPGTYRVYAWEDLEDAQNYTSAFLKSFEKQSVSVTVKENDTEQITLRQIPASSPLQ